MILRKYLFYILVLLVLTHGGAHADEEYETCEALVITISGMKGEPAAKISSAEELPLELIPVYGKPMISWVLEALRASRRVRGTTIVGSERLRKALDGYLKDTETFVVAGDKLTDRLAAGNKLLEDTVLVIPPDLVLITPDGIDNLLEECAKAKNVDIFYPVLKKEVCVSKYPWEKRTYARFRRGVFTGAHIMVFGNGFLRDNYSKVESLYLSRKSPIKMIRLIGFRRTFRFLIGRLRLRDIVDAIEKRYECKAKYIITDDVDLATDISESSEMGHIERVLRERAGAGIPSERVP